MPSRFVAAGVLTLDNVRAVSVIGQLNAPHPDPSGTRGETVAFSMRDGLLHWLILFGARTPVPGGSHVLHVHALDSNGRRYDAPPVHFSSVTEVISIGYPSEGANIYDDRDYFVAYGGLTHDAAYATMEPAGNPGGAIGANSLYSSVAYNFWSAVFPPLASNVHYLLRAEDSHGHTDTRGLHTTP